jgi:hypothetical protein
MKSTYPNVVVEAKRPTVGTSSHLSDRSHSLPSDRAIGGLAPKQWLINESVGPVNSSFVCNRSVVLKGLGKKCVRERTVDRNTSICFLWFVKQQIRTSCTLTESGEYKSVDTSKVQ